MGGKKIKLLTPAICNFELPSNHCNITCNDNFADLIIPYLYLGDEANSLDNKFLTEKNIKVIICVAKEVKNNITRQIQRHQIPFIDGGNSRIDKYLEEIIKLLDSYRQKKENVLVHCQMGVSRSVSFVIVYLLYLSIGVFLLNML